MALTLAGIKGKFPNGKFWNHSGPSNNQDGVTTSACASHNNTNTCNAFNPNGSNLSWQCMGFAEKCGYDTSDYNPRDNKNGWSTSTSSSAIDKLKAGDIVRYTNSYGQHSIFVTGVNGDTVTYGDCNGTSKLCEIRWGATISKTTLKNSFVHLRSAPKTLS